MGAVFECVRRSPYRCNNIRPHNTLNGSGIIPVCIGWTVGIKQCTRTEGELWKWGMAEMGAWFMGGFALIDVEADRVVGAPKKAPKTLLEKVLSISLNIKFSITRLFGASSGTGILPVIHNLFLKCSKVKWEERGACEEELFQGQDAHATSHEESAGATVSDHNFIWLIGL